MDDLIETNALGIYNICEGHFQEAMAIYRTSLARLRTLLTFEDQITTSEGNKCLPKGILYCITAPLPDDMRTEDHEGTHFSLYSQLFVVNPFELRRCRVDLDTKLQIVASVIFYNVGLLQHLSSKSHDSSKVSLHNAKRYYRLAVDVLRSSNN